MVGCSHANVSKGIKAGRLRPEFVRRVGQKCWVSLEALEVWGQTSGARRRAQLGPKLNRPVAEPPAPEPTGLPAAADDGTPRHETERRIAAVKLELLRMDAAERAGSLISAERVKKDQFEAGKRVRDAMLQIPVRLEHRIGREFAQLLEGEIRDQLTRVALEMQEGEE